jgi:UDP-glucose 4-epimerase
MKKNILITGGAGYIGSHTAHLLHKNNYHIIIIDKFLHDQKFDHNWARVIKGDFSDKRVLKEVFENNDIDAVMHFAAFIEVGESVKYPKKFYDNNVVKTIELLNTMLKYNVNKFVFSSSCAVYGEPIKIPMDESHSYAPISPYGKNKLAVEFALQDYSIAYGMRYVSLRYFNASGALPNVGLGEQHVPETHIIPLILRAINKNTEFKIFGTDYDTPDGTCIRDYIHVHDLSTAHFLALKSLENGNKSDSFNLGSGKGFSVKEMISMAERICGSKMKIKNESRRPGDPAILLADPSKAKKVLGWKLTHSSLENIIQSALEWERLKDPTSYETFSQSHLYKPSKL